MLSIKQIIDNLCAKCNTRNPYEIAEHLGIIVFYETLGDIRGFYSQSNRIQFIHINSDLHYHEQEQVCSHELGHAVMHSNANTPFLRANTLFSVNKYEVEANQFMSLLSIPPEDVQEWILLQYTVEQMARMTGLTPELVEYVIDEYIEDGDVELPSEEW